MVHATSAIAIAVLALNAASTLARPVEIQTDLAAREVDFDARDLEFGDYEFEAREPESEVDARDFDFGDFDVEERDFGEIVGRAPTTTATPVKAPTTTTTTHVAKPTGKDGKEIKNAKETKTVVVTVKRQAKTCKKPGLLSKLRSSLQRSREEKIALLKSVPLAGPLSRHQKHSLRRHLEAQRLKEEQHAARIKAAIKARKAGATPTPTTSTSSGAKATTTTAASGAKATVAKKTATTTANWSSITPPPTPKGAKVTQKKTVGKDKVTTIVRTVTAAPTACAIPAARKSKRDLEDLAEILERSYSFEDLD